MMKIRTVPPVTGENYYLRPKLVKKAWYLIDSEHHILITAPRRVGKTSLMFHLKNNQKDNCFISYINTESVNSINE